MLANRAQTATKHRVATTSEELRMPQEGEIVHRDDLRTRSGERDDARRMQQVEIRPHGLHLRPTQSQRRLVENWSAHGKTGYVDRQIEVDGRIFAMPS